jgi:MFS family permease
MARRSEIVTVYAAGVVQGVALVTFPAASAVFTSAGGYGLSNTEYGGMFVPQAVMAIVASLLGAGLTRRLGARRIYLLGLAANLSAMALLFLSKFVMREHAPAYGTLLVATTCMGIAFGFTVPALNTFAAAFFPQRVDQAVLGLNALLGLGTALAPVFIALFVGLGFWWGLPVLVGVSVLALLWFSLKQPLNENSEPRAAQGETRKAKLPGRFWIFAAFALLYGICETMNGNWASLYMKNHFGASVTVASLALTIFWSAVTAGRVLLAAIERWFPERVAARVLPLVVAAAFVLSAVLPKTAPPGGLLAFALAGLGCSALLPLTISFGQKELKTIAASVAGGLIAFYQIGYGIAAFGVGPLQSWARLDLNTIYGGTAVVALAMAALSFVLVRPETISSRISQAQTPEAEFNQPNHQPQEKL